MTYITEQKISSHRDYQRVASAIDFLVSRQASQPSLAELADYLSLSESHVQRLFSRWAGVSPKQFMQCLTAQYARQKLTNHSVFDAAVYSGLSGGNRLYDLMINYYGVTPGEYKAGGSGVTINWGFGQTPLGVGFIAFTDRGITDLAFLDDPKETVAQLNQLRENWPEARLVEDQQGAESYLTRIFNSGFSNRQPLSVVLRGTAFQLKVWEALIAIPAGNLVSYQQVAEAIGQPGSTRAVASVIARNNIAFLIPCHRVIRATGEFNQYRWGATRKKAISIWEEQHHSL